MGGLRSFFTGAGAAIRTLLVLQTAMIILLITSVGYLAHAVAGVRAVALSAESSADDANTSAEEAASGVSDIADGTTSVSCESGG